MAGRCAQALDHSAIGTRAANGLVSVKADDDLGGVDFSHLSLQTGGAEALASRCDAEALARGTCRIVHPVFTATLPSDDGDAGGSGCSPPATQDEAGLATQRAYCVWTSLPSHAFWVNLNPNQPDRLVTHLGVEGVIIAEPAYDWRRCSGVPAHRRGCHAECSRI